MDFSEWEPAYEAVLADFGYPRVADEAARDELAELVGGSSGPDRSGGPGEFDAGRLSAFDGDTVAIAGAAPTLPDELDVAADADRVIAASTAADVLAAAGIEVDLMTTDLDKNAETAAELTRAGTPVAVHAHGDNRDLLARHVPRMRVEHVFPTTQAAPSGPVWNVGGFTDGDRAAFIADHFGADRLRFPGWDFDDETVGPEKRRKLEWAERLLAWLERRRGERFAVLDGRREAVELPWLS